MSTSKEPAQSHEHKFNLAEVLVDAEPSESIVDAEGRHPIEPPPAPVPEDDDAQLEGSQRVTQVRRAVGITAPALDRVDLLRAGEDEAVDDRVDDAASSYGEWFATPGPSKLSATRSGAAVHALTLSFVTWEY